MNAQRSEEQHESVIPLFAISIFTFLLITLAAAGLPLVTPFIGLLLYFLGSKLIASKRDNQAFKVVVISLAIVCSMYGYFTHHPFLNTMGPFYGDAYEESTSGLIPLDSVKYRKGYLISYGPPNYTTADYDSYGVLTYEQDKSVIWATRFNEKIGPPVEMTIKRGFWRDRLNFFANEHDEPGWAYIWRWGSLQTYYVFIM